jgi:glucokinase
VASPLEHATPADLPHLAVAARELAPGYVAGADIGGTNQTVALARTDGRVVARRRRRLRPGGSAQDVIANVAGMLDEALAEALRAIGASEGTAEGTAPPLLAMGIGFGGPVDQRQGRVLTSHHVPGWTGFPLRDYFRDRLRAPVAVDNDANAAALGEALYGAGRGRQSVLYVNLGTGIGAGIVLNGRLLHGAHGMAGELGHVTVVTAEAAEADGAQDGAQCGCGKRGCLEAYASGRSIGRRAREAAARDPAAAAALVRAAGGNATAIQAPHVFQAAAGGDPLAQHLVDETAALLGVAFANAANLIDPDVIVVGGGLSETGDALFAPLRRSLATHLMPGIPPPDVVPAAYGYDGGIVGALALGFEAAS